ncbi:helix-turn-helix transcriptional regulator [Pseudoalteromonas sp. SR45-6]|uniref:AraC family transcriptional regulator n=1 Tax=Pseudoalteromonas sp. SR45-6 TaxID=2760927 RepID=UPI0016035F9B|nr:AraC family transcriptional regulator [Pseudoalteromonas sp. SR45-6]MBB1342872.1 helix-turn-helix transcriptional regulator [Pseudoalteromonas sp. SR45-6]
MHSEHTISIGHEFIDNLSGEEHGSQTEYIVTFINKGTLKMHHRGVVELDANMFTLIPAGMPHSLIEGENLDVWWVSFCPSCLGFNENDPLMRPFRQVRLGALPILKLDEKRLSSITFMFNELQQALKNAHTNYLEVYRSLLILILYEIEKATQLEKYVVTGSNKVVSALDYIQRHFLEPISLKDVAKAIHCSPSHLATLVKKDTGYSIGDWITRNRLTEACSRLLHTKAPINLIVEELGWNDTTHFIRQFKKAYGDTPAAWRKQQRAILNET